MTVTTTELRVYAPPSWSGSPLDGLCRGRCKRCGLRWWVHDPVAMAREHERECPGRPRSMFDGVGR